MNVNMDDFFAEKIVFEYPGKEIGKEEINELDDFPGKEDFVNFYSVHNGGGFLVGAWFFPEACYNVIKSGDDPFIALELFLKIPVGDKSDGLNIEVMKDRIVEKYNDFEDFVLFHIPFAVDVRGNPFWIDIQSGEIKYIDFQKSQNPDDAITVAFSFKDFCKCIRKQRM